MKSRCGAFICLVLFFSVLLSPRSGARVPTLAHVWNGAEISWNDLRSGVPEATRTGKTVMMVFHAPWCTSCKQYRTLFMDPRIVEASRNLVMILINADEDKTANGAFAPDGTYVPRTIFLTPDGDIRSDLVGKTDGEHPHTIDISQPDELLSLMRKAGDSEPDRDANQREQRAAN